MRRRRTAEPERARALRASFAGDRRQRRQLDGRQPCPRIRSRGSLRGEGLERDGGLGLVRVRVRVRVRARARARVRIAGSASASAVAATVRGGEAPSRCLGLGCGLGFGFGLGPL